MDQKRRDDFNLAWQRWCQACEVEWRDRREKREGKSIHSLGKLVEKQLGELGIQERMVEDQLVAAWQEVVGPANAMHSRPVALKRGELIVAVSQPAIKYTLERFHQGEILRRMQERFGSGTVRKLRFRLGN